MSRSLRCAVALALLALFQIANGRQIASEVFDDDAGRVENSPAYSIYEEPKSSFQAPGGWEKEEEEFDSSEESESFEEDEDEEDDDDEFSILEGGKDDVDELKSDLEMLDGNIRTITNVGFDSDLDVMMGDQPVVEKKKRRKDRKNKKRRRGKGKKRKGKGKKKSKKNKGEKRKKNKEMKKKLNGTDLQADMPTFWVDETGKLIEDKSNPPAAIQEDPDQFWPEGRANDDNNIPWTGMTRTNTARNPWDNNNNNNNMNPKPVFPDPRNNPDPKPVFPDPRNNPDPKPVFPDPRNNPNPKPDTNPNPNPNPHQNSPWDRPADTRTGAGLIDPRTGSVWPDNRGDVMGVQNNMYFDVTPLERFIQACPECFVQVPGQVCPFHGPALELKKWAGELEDVLSHGCKRPEECKEPGTCCLSRMEPFEPTVVRMTQMLKDVYNMVQRNCKGCQVDGNWGPWNQWSSCDRTCGVGTRMRSRECNNPPPSKTGQMCVGEATERKDCVNPECCVDGNWSPWSMWSTCPVTCGRAQVQRTRTCSNPPANYCGQTCPGNSFESRDEYCGPQGINGNWGSWGQWSGCPVSCGQATVTRNRICNNPPADPCGQPCFGDGMESKLQMCGPAAVDGNWAMWSSWSQCSVSCGPGTYSRSRRCSNPPASACGRQCPGPSFENAPCNLGTCEVCIDGNWGQWSGWSQCPVSCGEAMVTRTRFCNNPSPNYCGVSCPGSGTESRSEICGPPARDGNWAMWSTWTQCSATCGVGQRSRSRWTSLRGRHLSKPALHPVH